MSAIRVRRESLNLTQEAAARDAKLSVRTWVRVEDGDPSITSTTRAKVAAALRWPADASDRIAAGEDPASLQTVDEGMQTPEIDRLVALDQKLTIALGQNAELRPS